MEAPDYGISTTQRLENIIEKHVPKLFYKWNYSFENGLTIYVPKKCMCIIDQQIKDDELITSLRYEILDIEKEY